MTKLLACPFCGCSAEIERFGDHRMSTIYSCDGCGCHLETGEEWGHGRRWNTRAPDPTIAKQQEEIGRLRSALEFYADEANWTEPNQVNSQELFETPMGSDLGERARAALAKEIRHAD